MAENLKAFENLNEEGKDRLTAKEQTDLNKISAEDIRSEKGKIGEKQFKFYGQTMKLKDIVKNLQFDSAWQTASLNWKSISKWSEFWGSDLWAAIQVYTIAHNKSVGKFLIDGKVGSESIKWLQGTQTEVKAERSLQKKQPEKVNDSDEIKEQNVYRLVDAIYTDYVWKYNDPKYSLLNTKVWKNQGTLNNKVVEGNIVTIGYKSAVWNKEYQKITVDANVCKVWKQYSVDKFWKEIEKAISRKEAELKKVEDARIAKEKLDARQKAIVDAVESFNVGRLSKKVNAYFKEKNWLFGNNLDFQNWFWTWIHFAKDWKLLFGQEFSLDQTQINSLYAGNVFNAEMFKNILNSKFTGQAEKYFQEKAKKLAGNLPSNVTVGSIGTARQNYRYLKWEIDQIGALGVDVKTQQDQLKDMDERLNSMDTYRVVSKWVNQRLAELTRNFENSNGSAWIKAGNELRKFYRYINERKLGWRVKDGEPVVNVYSVYTKIDKRSKNGEWAKAYEALKKRAQEADRSTRYEEK